MALVVHVPFEHDGQKFVRGDVIQGVRAEVIAKAPLLSRHCSPVADDAIGLAREAAPAPAEKGPGFVVKTEPEAERVEEPAPAPSKK